MAKANSNGKSKPLTLRGLIREAVRVTFDPKGSDNETWAAHAHQWIKRKHPRELKTLIHGTVSFLISEEQRKLRHESRPSAQELERRQEAAVAQGLLPAFEDIASVLISVGDRTIELGYATKAEVAYARLQYRKLSRENEVKADWLDLIYEAMDQGGLADSETVQKLYKAS